MAVDYTTTFSVDRSPERAFAAILDIRGWWAGEIAGSTDQLGDEFTYRVRDIHYSKQRVTGLVPAQKLSWLVVDSRLDRIADKREWTGTTISFELLEHVGGTEVRFTHEGLVPSGECYNDCSSAWTYYVNDRLRGLMAG